MKHLHFTLKTVCILMLAFFFGSFVASAAGFEEIAPTIGLSAVALAFVPKGLGRAQLNAIVIADIIAEFGAYYRPGGQGMKNLIKKFLQKSITEGYFPRRITEATIMEQALVSFQRVLQRFQKQWSPTGGATFTPTKIPLFGLKIDEEFYPDEIEESWLGFLADNNLDRKEWPIVRFMVEGALDKAQEDLEVFEIYKGVLGTITPGVANPAGTSMDGIRKQINSFITAGDIVPVTLGAIPTDAADFVSYVEELINSTPRLLRNNLDYVFMNEDNADLFRDGMTAKYNVNYLAIEDAQLTKMRHNNIRVVGLPSMAGDDKVWATPKFNRQGGIKKPGNENIMRVENVDRLVKIYTDYYKGFGFWNPEWVVTNDLELT
jgi:hypothetical protein